MNEEYKIINWLWLSGESYHSIGFVAIASGPNQEYWKCYAGVQAIVNETENLQKIAAHGVKVPKEIAMAVFPNLPGEKYVY